MIFQIKEKSIIRWMWIGAIVSVIIPALILTIVSLQKLPSFTDLENPTDNLASELLSADGIVIGRYFTENRVPVKYSDLSPHLVDALIAAEDVRYYDHTGIDFKALFRVLFKSILMGNQESGGGSTISQQLAKLLYPRPNYSGMGKAKYIFTLANTKFREWITAIKLEKSYTKEEIITMYFNEFDFLYQGIGIKAAAETYFGKNPIELNESESAILVGMFKNPDVYNPKKNPENAFHRRNTVLYQMRKNNKLDKETYDSLITLEIDVSNFKRTAHDEGIAPYFRAELKKTIRNILSKEQYKKPDGSYYDLDRDGLTIQTTLDSRYQIHAEKAVQKRMSNRQKVFFKHWSWGKTPWEYGDDKKELKNRQIRFEYLVMGSERFQNLMQTRFTQPTLEAQSKIKNVQFTPYTMDVLTEYLDGVPMDSLVSNKSRARYLEKVAKSKEFKPIEKAWRQLIEEANKIFDTPVKMKVFDYESPGFEKDTIMTPRDSVRYHRMILQAGLMAMEPGTGYVRAWVGGVNFKYFKQDHVTVNRQVGSTFKPFVYTAAITMQGVSPCQKYMDEPVTIAAGEGNFGLIKNWSPKNSTNEYEHEYVDLYYALRNSVNSVTVQLVKQLGTVEPIFKIVKNMGLDTDKMPRVPSICLGVADLQVQEMTAAYGTFANNGVYVEPIIIKHIYDNTGRLIYKAVLEQQQAIPEDVNYVVVDLLKNVAEGKSGLRELKIENGGKTGTTQDQTDAWYMGITPNLVVGVWVGGEDRWIRFRNISEGQGAVLARPIFSEFMKSVENDPNLDFDSSKKFYKPPGELSISIDCEVYEQARQENLHPEEQKR